MRWRDGRRSSNIENRRGMSHGGGGLPIDRRGLCLGGKRHGFEQGTLEGGNTFRS